MDRDHLFGPDHEASPLAVGPQRSHGPDSTVLPTPDNHVGAAGKISSGHTRHMFAAGSHKCKKKLDGMNRVPGEIEIIVLPTRWPEVTRSSLPSTPGRASVRGELIID